MSFPAKSSEALNETECKIKSFRKAMMALLFQWQDLETRLESPTNQIREIEIREQKLGFVSKEIDLREKELEEKEKFVEQERKQLEGERKLIEEGLKEIGEKEKHIKQCFEDLRVKEEEVMEQVKIVELKEKKVVALKKELELKEKELNFSVNQVGSSNQSMPHESTAQTRLDHQKTTNGKLRSKAWQHFTKIVNQDEATGKAKCNYCHKIFRIFGGGTGHLLRHIFEGICPAYRKSTSAYQNREVIGQTFSEQFCGSQKEEQSVRQNGVGEHRNKILVQAKLQTRLFREPQMMSSSKTCTIQNVSVDSDLDYEPHQMRYPHSQSLLSSVSDTSKFPTDCSGSEPDSDSRTRMGNSDKNCRETHVTPGGNFDSVETESGDTRGKLISQGRKRNREYESGNHQGVEDLSALVKTEEPCYNNFLGENDEKPEE